MNLYFATKADKQKHNTIQTKKKRAHLNSTVVQITLRGIALCYDQISWYIYVMGYKQVHKFFKVHKVLLNAIYLVHDAFKISMSTEKCCQTARDLSGRPRFSSILYFVHSSDRSSTPNSLNIVFAGETTLLFKVNRKFKRMR